DRFTPEEKRANSEYHDPHTTGESTPSAGVQSSGASEVGYHGAGVAYFRQAVSVELGDLHGDTVGGMHVASLGGVWSALTFGFAGMNDRNGRLSFAPRLPKEWSHLAFKLAWRGSRLQVTITQDELRIEVLEKGEDEVRVRVRGEVHSATIDRPLRVALPDQGPLIDGLLGKVPQTGGTRADGTTITAGVPEPMAFDEEPVIPAE